MGIPVRLKIDNFVHLGEEFKKGDIFNAPHEAFASFLCEQEGTGERVNENECAAEKVGTNKRTMKKGKASYNTKVMTPDVATETPVVTKQQATKQVQKKSTAKANVDAAKDAT